MFGEMQLAEGVGFETGVRAVPDERLHRAPLASARAVRRAAYGLSTGLISFDNLRSG